MDCRPAVPTDRYAVRREYFRTLRGHRPRLTFDCVDCGVAVRSYTDTGRCPRCRVSADRLAADPDWRPGRKTLRSLACARCGEPTTCRGSRVFCEPCRDETCRARDARKSTSRIARLNATRGGQQAKRRLAARLLERYGGRCGICHLAIDLELRCPHPLSLTLDHIHPLSAGGPDTEGNLWPAHRRCNEEKGDDLGYRPDSALFGVAS